MLSFLLSILEAYASNPPLVYAFLFLDAALTTVPVVGVIVLETPVAVLAGALASQGYFSVWWAALWGVLGAIAGDAGGYYAGRWLGFKLINHPRIISRQRFEQAHRFFRAHGGKSLVLARFIGPLRTIIPLVAGVVDMAPGAFWFYNIAGAVIWALVFFPLGFFFGRQWQVIVSWAERGGWIALIIVVLIGLIAWKKSTSNRPRV